MRQVITANHWNDADGNPAGGSTYAEGFAISWQNGPLGRRDSRVPPNGAFVEGVIQAAIDRLDWYQDSRFNCEANMKAINCLTDALEHLDARTADREAREVEGTHAE